MGKKNQQLITALYERLSHDDGRHRPSCRNGGKRATAILPGKGDDAYKT